MDYEELQRIQNFMAKKLAEETEFDKKIIVLKVIQSMLTSKKRVSIEEIIVECSLEGVSETEAYALIEEMKKEGIIESKGGFISLR